MECNNITIAGNLGRDPEIRHVGEKSTPLTKVSVAVRRRSKGQDATDWFNVSVWGKTAEFLAEYGKKGDPVIITGAMTSNKVDDKLYWDVQANTVSLGRRQDPKPEAAPADDLPF